MRSTFRRFLGTWNVVQLHVMDTRRVTIGSRQRLLLFLSLSLPLYKEPRYIARALQSYRMPATSSQGGEAVASSSPRTTASSS